MYFEHDLFFFEQRVFLQKKKRDKKYVYMIEKTKQKILFENCKRFFKKKKQC